MALLVTCWVIVFATHLLGAVAAFGSTFLALPFMVWCVDDLDTAVLVLLVVGTVQSYHLFGTTRRAVCGPELRRLLVLAGVAMPVGFLARELLPARPLLLVLAALLLAGGSQPLWARDPARSFLAARGVPTALLVAGGLIHGAFGCGGTTLVLYLRQRSLDKDPFRATLNAFWVIVNTALIAAFLARGVVPWATVRLIAVGVLAVVPANYLANHLSGRLSQAWFQWFVCALLTLAGLVMLARVVR